MGKVHIHIQIVNQQTTLHYTTQKHRLFVFSKSYFAILITQEKSRLREYAENNDTSLFVNAHNKWGKWLLFSFYTLSQCAIKVV